MISTAKKGYNREKIARDGLEEKGWNIAFKSIRWRFGCIDFAALFDIVAVKGRVWRFISVKHFGKSNYFLPHQKEIKIFKEKHGFSSASFELWLWCDKRTIGRGSNKKIAKAYWKKIVIKN